MEEAALSYTKYIKRLENSVVSLCQFKFSFSKFQILVRLSRISHFLCHYPPPELKKRVKIHFKVAFFLKNFLLVLLISVIFYIQKCFYFPLQFERVLSDDCSVTSLLSLPSKSNSISCSTYMYLEAWVNISKRVTRFCFNKTGSDSCNSSYVFLSVSLNFPCAPRWCEGFDFFSLPVVFAFSKMCRLPSLTSCVFSSKL